MHHLLTRRYYYPTACLFLLTAFFTTFTAPGQATELEPVKIIFDTDIGNDIDDALALAVIHALVSRSECELLAVTISKDNPYCAPYVDIINTLYGRGDIPIGVVREGKTPEDGKFVRQVSQARDDGQARYAHDLTSGADAREAVDLLRATLAAQPDHSVVLVVVGFSTNVAKLLDSSPDKHAPLSGLELVAHKCRLLSIMAGMFTPEDRVAEYNVRVDAESAARVYEQWPTEIVVSGYEIGRAIKYPAISIERDFRYAEPHPVCEAYALYGTMPYDRETWDLTSVLYAVRPDRDYFGLSEPGRVWVDEQAITQFEPLSTGRHRYLTVDELQIERVREALIQLASQPPTQ